MVPQQFSYATMELLGWLITTCMWRLFSLCRYVCLFSYFRPILSQQLKIDLQSCDTSAMYFKENITRYPIMFIWNEECSHYRSTPDYEWWGDEVAPFQNNKKGEQTYNFIYCCYLNQLMGPTTLESIVKRSYKLYKICASLFLQKKYHMSAIKHYVLTSLI